jgi:sulfur carrier protein ThiS
MLAMRIQVEILPARESKEVELPPDATGLDLVKALDLAPDAHILVRGDVPIPLDEPLADGEALRLIGVVSGGS